MEWLQPTSHSVEPRYYGTSNSGSGTLQLGNSTNVQGAYKCHRGKTTGYSCGTLTSVAYKPTYANAWTQTQTQAQANSFSPQ